MERKAIVELHTFFMHPTDEHLRHADIFFSNYYNLQFVHFEWIYILRARASIIFMMSMILRSTVQRFFSHTEEGS